MLDSTWWSVLLLQGLVLVRAQRGTRNCVVDGVEMCQYESHREMIVSVTDRLVGFDHQEKVECNFSFIRFYLILTINIF